MKQPAGPALQTKSILLVASTSSYFGGTGVTAYVASKHGVLGLLRASQSAAREHGVRVNAVAPFFTPTHITAGFSRQWRDAGLDENTPERVAETIALVALDAERRGHCVLVRLTRPSWICSRLARHRCEADTNLVVQVAGQYLRELEVPRSGLLPTWLGEDVSEFMGRAMRFFTSIGGYVLPQKG